MAETIERNEKGGQLVVIPLETASELFVTPHGLQETLNSIATLVRSEAFDVTTTKGRAEIKSLAARIAQSKTYLDGIGKQIVDEMKELPKKVDENRKLAREFLDALKVEIRKPLTDWEDEQEAIKAKQEAEKARAELEAQIERDHELALLMNAEFDRKREDEARAKQQAEEDRITQAVKEAAAKALQDAQNEVLKAQLDKERAERFAIEAKQQHEEMLKQQAEKAARDAEKAIEDERRRIELERQAELAKANREKAEQEALELAKSQDREHRKAINTEALKSLCDACSIDAELGKKVLAAIAKGQVQHVSIKY